MLVRDLPVNNGEGSTFWKRVMHFNGDDTVLSIHTMSLRNGNY